LRFYLYEREHAHKKGEGQEGGVGAEGEADSLLSVEPTVAGSQDPETMTTAKIRCLTN